MTEIAYRLEPRHLLDYQFAIRNRLSRNPKRGAPKAEWLRALLFGLACGVIYFALLWLWPRMAGVDLGVAELVVGFILGAAAAVGSMWWHYAEQRRLMVKPDGPSLGEHVLSTSATGVSVIGQNFENRYAWPIFEDATRYSGILVLWIEPGMGLIIPRVAFDGEAAEAAFLEDIRGNIRAATV